ncbi:MAG: hypothetical protein O7E52_17190 [Candidatus Poribacteria bacterium]|nr:hypothetical protein [Candidatus Poribacteria bacterium]
MQEKRTVKGEKLPNLAVRGGVGFGLGGAIGGAMWVAFDAPHLGFATLGAVGGAFLGSALKDRKRPWLLAFAGAIGFTVGFFIPFFIVMAIWEPIFTGLFIGAIAGAIGGGVLGLALKQWKKVAFLALAAAIGFGIAVQATWDGLRGFTPQILGGAMSVAIWGIVGGASLGVALGYLETEPRK